MSGFNQALLVLHFVGLAMGLAVPLSNLVLAGLMSGAEPADAAVLRRFPPAMSKVGKVGLALLWITGVTMVYTRWGGFGTLPPTFHVKLAVVVLLTATIGYIQLVELRARKGDAAAFATLQRAGKVAALLALAAVILAVMTFK